MSANIMKLNKSKTLSVKCNSIMDNSVRNQQTLQRQAAKKYLKFKKSASQPVYFLNQSRLKRISDAYRKVSIERLSKSSKNIKSLYNSLTPQKKNSFHQNVSTKKNNLFNTVNMNKLFDTNQKTKRLVLTKPAQKKQKYDHIFQLKQVLNNFQKLEEINKLNMQKSFLGQYLDFVKTLGGAQKQNCNNFQNLSFKQAMIKFMNLIQTCQKRVYKYQQKESKLRHSDIQLKMSQLSIQLKKKQIKIELLNRQLQELKHKNNDFKDQKFLNSKYLLKQKMKIQSIFQIKLSSKSNKQAKHELQIKYLLQQISNLKTVKDNFEIDSKNKAVQMIAKIRDLQKKQKQLVSVLVLLRNDGINIQKAYEDIMNNQEEQRDNNENESEFETFAKFRKQIGCVPKYIKLINNNNSYDGDISIISSCDGLSLNNIDQFEVDQNYPIKRQYKSKVLNQQLQQKLRLDFNCLYQDSSFQEQQYNQTVSNAQNQNSHTENN